jgi:hypothetical protein
MTPGDEYRVKAAELRAKAAHERDPAIRADFDNLASAFLRLAALAERNNLNDISYETPAPKSGDSIPGAK